MALRFRCGLFFALSVGIRTFSAGVEDGLDEVVETVGVGGGGFEEFEVPGGKRGRRGVEEEGEGHLDAGERSFEFVAEGGEEAGLGFVDLAELSGVDQEEEDAGDGLIGGENGDGAGEEEEFLALVENLDGGLGGGGVGGGLGLGGGWVGGGCGGGGGSRGGGGARARAPGARAKRDWAGALA